jgi:hypothetical protein
MSEPPRIAGNLLKVSQGLDRAMCDKERLCYLVSDTEWTDLVMYISQFEYREYLYDERVVTMTFAGIEVIKRSSVLKAERAT